MVPYAVEMFLDAPAEAAVRAVWKGIADVGLGRSMLDMGSRPHISLAVYDGEAEVDELGPELGRFAAGIRRIPLRLSGVGTFPGSGGVVFLVPASSAALVECHRLYHERFSRLDGLLWPYYRPGLWVAHCTVAMDGPPELVPDVVERTLELFQPLDVTIGSVGLVSCHPAEVRVEAVLG